MIITRRQVPPVLKLTFKFRILTPNVHTSYYVFLQIYSAKCHVPVFHAISVENFYEFGLQTWVQTTFVVMKSNVGPKVFLFTTMELTVSIALPVTSTVVENVARMPLWLTQKDSPPKKSKKSAI